MENVNLNMVYRELLALRKEVKKIEEVLICEEKISAKERLRLQKELDLVRKEGGTNFRDVGRK